MSLTEGIARVLGGVGRTLAREVTARGAAQHVVALAAPWTRPLERAGHRVEVAEVEDGRVRSQTRGADAVCLDLNADANTVADAAQLVRAGGWVLAPSGTAERAQMAALLLHAGLVDVAQRQHFGVVVTSARVRR